MRGEIRPGTPALCVPSSDAVIDGVRDAFEDQAVTPVGSGLGEDQEAGRREVSAVTEAPAPATAG
ncbi:hypothetical protein ACI8AV_06575 [Geodermatophilus sp. SYSU D00804]